MKFLNPSGFWLLLGVPLLIIIYIIKSRHEDRPVSSTYIWKLSTKLKKKRFPLQRIRKLLVFFMQLLMIVLLSFVAAQPAVAGGEGYDTIVILDASASMLSVDEGDTTRFEKALSDLKRLAKKTEQEHTFTLILANDTPTYAVLHAQTESDVKKALDKISCSYGGCNEEEALILAGQAAELSDNARVFFYTDHGYESCENISVTDYSVSPWNVALEGLEMEKTAEESFLITGTVTSYGKEAQITVGLRLDDKAVDAQRIVCPKDTATQVVFEIKQTELFDTAEIYVNIEDALEADNSYALCNCRVRPFTALLVSEQPLYLENALKALGNCTLTVTSSLEQADLLGKDLYIFDGITPEQYPTDGAILVFGTDHLPNGLISGISYDSATKPKVNKEASFDFSRGLSFEKTMIKKYTALIGGPEWTPILYCGNAAVLMTATQPGGMQCSVFSFDLHDSNLPLQTEYLRLLQGIIEYSLPSMLKITDYTVGQTAEVAVLPRTEKLYIGYPGESFKELSVSQAVYPISLSTVGVYSVVASYASKDGVYTDFFAHVPLEEMANSDGEHIVVILNEQSSDGMQRYDGIFFYLALAILLILLVEWGVYYSEQY